MDATLAASVSICRGGKPAGTDVYLELGYRRNASQGAAICPTTSPAKPLHTVGAAAVASIDRHVRNEIGFKRRSSRPTKTPRRRHASLLVYTPPRRENRRDLRASTTTPEHTS